MGIDNRKVDLNKWLEEADGSAKATGKLNVRLITLRKTCRKTAR